jgi:putative methanogenesis marker protein 8
MGFGRLLDLQKTQDFYLKDYHILRFYSAFVAVSHGKVIGITDPSMRYCPLAEMFYKKMRNISAEDKETIKNSIKEIVQDKIKRFGFFTENRDLLAEDVSVPYGASEILMYAMNKKEIDAAVIVCDGAGSVVVRVPGIIQGIGARMNGLFYTTPISGTIKKLQRASASVVFSDARIDQAGAVEYACQKGYKKIAVTVNASLVQERFEKIRELAKRYSADIIVLAVCTTGIGIKRSFEVKEYADVVWSCASSEIRDIVGRRAALQVSEAIPVFVLTKRGLDLLSSYSDPSHYLKNLDFNEQHIISRKKEGRRIRMGCRVDYLSQFRLPVRSAKEPMAAD